MPSYVDIANMALTRLGAGTILSLEDQGNAALVKTIIPMVRRAEFAEHMWKEGITRAELPANSTPKPGYKYAYDIPSGCIRVLEVGYNAALVRFGQPYVIEGNEILTNAESPLFIRYMQDNDNPERWSGHLATVMAYRIAMELCERITESNTKMELLQRDYRSVLNKAAMADAMSSAPVPQQDTSWDWGRI